MDGQKCVGCETMDATGFLLYKDLFTDEVFTVYLCDTCFSHYGVHGVVHIFEGVIAA